VTHTQQLVIGQYIAAVSSVNCRVSDIVVKSRYGDCCSDDDDVGSPALVDRLWTLFPARRSTSAGVERVDAGVATIDLELDAPDDVVEVVPTASGVDVALEDQDRLDASLHRLAVHRSSTFPTPAVSAQSFAVVESGKPAAATASAAACEAPCAAERCRVPMADVPYDPSPCARCSRSLERVGFLCDVECACPVSKADGACQTDRPLSSRSSRTPRTSRASSRSSRMASATETGTDDLDGLFSESHGDNTTTVS